MTRRHALAAAAALALSTALVAQAQEWPAGKTIRIVVPYTPGGSSDIIARAVSQPLADALKTTVIVENRPGANGNTGTDAVAKSPGDGLTLLLCDVGALAITPSVYSKLPFDPKKDLRGVTMLAYSPHLLVVHPSVAANNLKELVALSGKGNLNFAVTALGSAPHLAGIAVEKATNAKWVYVPYKGGSLALNDLIGGSTHVIFPQLPVVIGAIQSDQVKALAVTTRDRLPQLPNVPTMAEAALPGFNVGGWNALFGPRGLPDDIRNLLGNAIVAAVKEPELAARLRTLGVEPVGMGADEATNYFKAEYERWKKVIDSAGLKLEK